MWDYTFQAPELETWRVRGMIMLSKFVKVVRVKVHRLGSFKGCLSHDNILIFMKVSGYSLFIPCLIKSPAMNIKST